MLATANPFLTYWALGYHRLVPIVPPDATISANSTLSKRLNTKSDPRGKAPGVRGRNGLWYGFDWIPHEPDETDLQRWHAMGAGTGIKTGQGILAIDADTLDQDCAKLILGAVKRHFGDTPIRVGNYPKALYLIRCDEDYRYTRVEFGAHDERGYQTERVEVLSDGRQFVAHGIHPKTLKPYSWPKPLLPFDELTRHSAEAVDAFMLELQNVLPNANRKLVKEGANSDVNQAALRGDPSTVAKAVEAMANTSELFPTRESFIAIGYAIKAALPDNPDQAFDLFADWASRWTDDHNDPDFVAAEWGRMKPPYKRGAGWLYEQAETASEGRFRAIDAWFEPIPDQQETNPFAAARLRDSAETKLTFEEAVAAAIRTRAYAFPEPSKIDPRQFLYGNHYVRKYASTTVAPSGVGKSSLEIVEALAMASGKPLLGVEPRGKFRVWLWNGEDPLDELDRRIAAAMQHYGLTPTDIGNRLFIDSGRNMRIVTALETRDGARLSDPVVSAIIGQLRENAIDVMQIDPFISTHRISENDNGAIDMVAKEWARIADETLCGIELVHHVRKLNGGPITVEDSRGAVALIGAVRSARALMKMDNGSAQRLGVTDNWRYFHFGDAKNNLAPPSIESSDQWMKLFSVDLPNGDNVGVVGRADPVMMTELLTEGEVEGAKKLIGGEAWRLDVRCGDRWVGVPIAVAIGLDHSAADDRVRLKRIIEEWVKLGHLVMFEDKDEKRRQRTFVRLKNDLGSMFD